MQLRHLGLAALVGASSSLLSLPASADPVYGYRSPEGRMVYTNVRSLAPSNVALEELDLPSLVQLDLAQANEAELQRIQERLARHHKALTTSPACAEAIEEGEVPWYRRLYESDPHWFALGALLLAMGLMGRCLRGALPEGMWTRTVMFMLPMLLGVGIVGSLGVRVSSALRAVSAEASACSETLPAAKAGDRHSVQQNAGIVANLQHVLNGRARRMQAQSDALTREYQM